MPRLVDGLCGEERIGVVEVLRRRDAARVGRRAVPGFRCPACEGRVFAHKAGTTGQGAHFEHRPGVEACRLSGPGARREVRVLWCWRCRAEMPMLDEKEWALVLGRRVGGLRGYKEGEPGMLAEYARITGYVETNVNALWHHRLEMYGLPCRVCGKPLRTPKARFCAGCGTGVE